ncbi:MULTISPECIES: protein adenylyltransferase SelO [Cyanophyceae]|uniref:protein adenylyltransferase SelO n=1 Tax=Cyanophyceae TaxID=3028117 RepID=UPI001689ACE4|nr:YdiU family protein [Trichocoleus sp. FACHB-40]MBD2005486.1 YdiU family protein [Trichocoleus sp. FACHB-40]
MTPENSSNPFLNLNYDSALEALGDDFFDEVAAAEFPKHILRFRNDELVPKLGLKPEEVTDEDFIEAFGKFQGRKPFLALRYHGYQFGEYNPRLGDGRGFLYGQVRGTDGELYDFGTKGSGTTPYSRGGDGRLTLKGGVREVLASEALHYLGVYTSRCLSMIETGDALWRGDEPSPTRSSVMVRFSRSHIRFGTFERLHNFARKDLIQQLLDHVIVQYYPHLKDKQDRYALFYAELVQRVAMLVAQWMSVGFCHAVLNTDNMSITGESFDYGPFAFIDTYNPQFTAAYFDYYGRYSYGNQPGICKLNLEMLQDPLSAVIPVEDMQVILKEFDEHYYQTYNERMLNKLGLANLAQPEAEELLMSTLTLLQKTQVGYHTFFSELTEQFNRNWRDDAANILKSDSFLNLSEAAGLLEAWRNLYLQTLLSLPESEMDNMLERLQRHNPKTVLLRPEIEAVWEKIDQEDNWEPFYQLISRLRFHQDAA